MHTLPFSSLVTKRIFELLDVLNCIVNETDGSGGVSEAGLQILNDHFVGEKAWFTDESDTNKRAFKYAMTFPDMNNPDGEKLFCPWHGKIKTPQIRIHFEWPRPKGQKR